MTIAVVVMYMVMMRTMVVSIFRIWVSCPVDWLSMVSRSWGHGYLLLPVPSRCSINNADALGHVGGSVSDGASIAMVPASKSGGCSWVSVSVLGERLSGSAWQYGVFYPIRRPTLLLHRHVVHALHR